MIVIRNIESGDRQIVESLDGINPAEWTATDEVPPTDLENRVYRSDTVNGLVAAPLQLWPDQVLALHTIQERGAARRMITAVFPTGHPLEGQLIDPDATVQVLLDALIARRTPLSLDDSYFTQGVELLLGLGLLTEARAARVRLGLPPE